jgi:hypothetical protein
MSIKNTNDTIGYRTRELQACNAVPQPTAPPRIPEYQTQYKGADKSLARPTSRYILFGGENISFDASSSLGPVRF